MSPPNFIDRLMGSPGAPGTSSRSDSANSLENLLTPGRTVKATVLEMLPGGQAMVKLAGQTLVAQSEASLTPGQQLTLTVEQTNPTITLSMGGEKAPVINLPMVLGQLMQVRHNLAMNLSTVLKYDAAQTPPPTPEAGRLAEGLQQASRDLLAGESPTANRQVLKDFAKNSGMDMEAALARSRTSPASLRAMAGSVRSLAAALERELASALGGRGPGMDALRGLLEAAKGLKSAFEGLQMANAELSARESMLLLAIPMALGDEMQGGELLLELPEPDEHGRRRGATRVVFFLELTALGPLTVEANVNPEMVVADFVVDSEEKAAFLRGLLPGLAQRLESAGFQATLTARSRSPREIDQQTPLARLIRERGQYLSLTV